MKKLIEVIEKTIRYHQKLLRTKGNPLISDCPMCIFYKKISAFDSCGSCILRVNKTLTFGCSQLMLKHCSEDEKCIILALKKLLVVAKQPKMSMDKLRKYIKNANRYPKKYFKF